ncbi:MAG: hypothetical protein ACW99U_12040 [Candidatus Thorarchaeota archaeon]
MSSFPISKTFYWALTGVFAALQVVMTAFPYSITLGVAGTLTVGLVSAPLIGFLLGPIFGTIAVLIGSLLGMFINPTAQVFGYLTAISPTIGALVAGSIRTKKSLIVPLIYIVSIVMYIVGPIGTLTLGFLWLHVIALLLSFVFFIPKISERFTEALDMEKGLTPLSFVSIWLLVFIAVLADHVVGSMIGSYYFFYVFAMDASTLAAIFNGITFVYPLERLLGSLAGLFVILAVARAIKEANIELPTTERGIHELSSTEIE